MSLNSCSYSSVSIDNGLSWAKCPTCGRAFTLSTAFTSAKTGLTASKPDYNLKVALTCPLCNAKINLFVAVHRFTSTRFSLCIQRSDGEGSAGIPVGWWSGHP